MAQAKLNSQEETNSTLNDKEKETDEKEGSTTVLECAVCLQPCIYPARLPCNHIYCYLCVKGVANQSKRCPMCRQEIPPDFLNRPQLVEVDETQKESEHFEEEYQWFYEGRNGWWQYDQRTSHELETAYKQGKRNCELLIAGFLYIADFGSMLQLRRNDPSRRRKIKRDLYNVPKKGVAGLRLNNQDEEITREVRGAERPASPASDDMGTGDGTNTPVPPSNTPQTPAGGTASGDATPLNDRMEQRDSLHQSSMEEILQFVRGQWQLSDLREINNDNGSLPPKLSEKKFIILSGNYILQVEQMYNITKAKYKQLKEIRNVNFSEVDPAEEEMMKKMTKTRKKRMMQLKLTDGVQNIIGIEYNPISQLNDMLLPGYKLMIIGPIICRRGVLLLEEGKLKGIGGEVDNLLISNALENILARALNLPENPDPYNDNEIKSNNIQKEEIDDNFFEEDFQINFANVSKNTNSHNKNEEIAIESHSKNETKIYDKNPIKTKIENINTEIKNVQNYEDEKIIDDDDCFLEMIDEKQFIETQIEQNIITPFKTLPNEENNDLIIINEEEENEDVKHDIFKSTIKNDSSHLYPTSLVTKKNVSHSKIQEKQCLLINKEISASTSSETITLKKNKMDRHITEFVKVVTVPKEEKICEFIHDINNEIITNNIFKIIRGHVEVLGKLSKKDSLWILEAIIGDGTGTIEVSFSNKLLENLLGFSVKEFSLKKKLKKNPEIEHELRMSFRNAEQKIKTLDALLKLELNINKKPIVIEIMDLTEEQKKIIDKRLSNFLKIINR